ncbi:MAG TPA: hypothetical protein VJ999_01775 [Candidatus Sulfotelmatobacter sp.]|nr:hypothetical protein [Candidatus Sulfotelmatobacter sp.]
MADTQFRDLRRGAGNWTLVAFAAGLRVIEGSEAVTELLDFLELHLIRLMGGIVGEAVAFVVKTGGRFG